MGLEVAVYVSDLDHGWPIGYADRFVFCDDHIRLLKSVLKSTFPNVTGAVTATHDELNILDGVTASAAEINILDGATITTTELNYADGLTSACQTQLDAKHLFLQFSVKVGSGASSFTASFGNSSNRYHYLFTGDYADGIYLGLTSQNGLRMRITNLSGAEIEIKGGNVAAPGTFTINNSEVSSFTIANGVSVELVVIYASSQSYAKFDA